MAFFPNQNSDPFPRNLMVPGRVQGVNAQAQGFGTSQYGAMGGNPALKSAPNGIPTLSGRPNPTYPIPPFQPPGGGGPGPVKGGGNGQKPGQGQYWGANPNQLLKQFFNLQGGGEAGHPGPLGPPIGVARDPREHLRWWLQHGWRYNENKGRFRQVPGSDYTGPNPGGRPNPMEGGGNVGIPGGTPGPTTGAGGGAEPTDATGNTDLPGGLFDDQGGLNPGAIKDLRKQFGIPNDSIFEAQRRQLVDQLNAQMAQIIAQRGQLEGNYGLQTARLGTQQGLADKALIDQMAARGIYGSGVQNRAQTLQDADYARQGQDLGFQQAQGLGDLAAAQSGLQGNFEQGLMEALLALIQRQAQTGGKAPKGKG